MTEAKETQSEVGISSQKAPQALSPTNLEQSNTEDLATRLKEIEGVNESTAEFLANNWQKLLGFCLICLLGIWLFIEYRSALQSKSEEAAFRFGEFQEMYHLILDGSENKNISDETLKPFYDSADLLEQSYGTTIYSKMSELYLALADLKVGNSTRAISRLKKLGSDSYDGILKVDTSRKTEAESIISEFAALISSRIMADEGKIEHADKRLLGLAYGGKLLNGEAVIALLNMAYTDELLDSATKTAKVLIAARPEFGDQLRAAFKSRGVNL